MGTAGQRCTTLRRLFVADEIYQQFLPRLSQVYASVRVGDPRAPDTLVGPLIDRGAFENMERALAEARAAGGTIQGGERVEGIAGDGAYYVRPALCEMPNQTGPVQRETFAPILYVMRFSELDEAIRLQNAVGAGLASCIFTLDVREAERFMSADGLGLRHRQRQHRAIGSGDRRRFRRREGDRRRPRGGLRFLESLHAPGHQHDQLRQTTAAGARRAI